MPTADRDITVMVTMTGTGATLSGLTNGTLTIERGANSGSFAIAGDEDDDATDGEVTLTLDANQDDYVFPGSPFTATVTIIDDEEPNKPPVIATISPITVEENQTAVATLEATDSDNDPITGWSITGGADSALFDLTNGGALTFKTAPDYENPTDVGADNSYLVVVTASDGKDDSAELTLTVNVTDVNEPPDAPTGLSVSPNEENPTTTLDVSWTAPDTTGIPPITGYDVQYRVHGQTDWLYHNFDSVGTTTNTTVSDLASNTTYQVQVRAKNDEGEGPWAMDSGTTEKAQLTVAFTSATYTVDEGSNTDINVNVAPTADRNVTVTVTMTSTGATLSGLGTGNALTIERDQSSASFTISGDQDNDNVDDVVTLTLTTNADGVTLGSPSTTTVTIEEPNIPPVVATTSPVTVNENQTGVATLVASDADDDPIAGWSITGGADSGLFNLTNDGVLSFKTAPDYENPRDTGSNNSYEIEVTASDGTDNSAPLMIMVNVTDLDEPPGAPTGLSVSTNNDNPTTTLDVSWTAPDITGIPPIAGYDVQYRAGGSGDWTVHKFDSASTTTETIISDLASNSTYQVRVRADNDEGEGPWAMDSGTTDKALLTVAFSSAVYTVDEGDTATSTVMVSPIADRNVTTTITMSGTGATLSGLTNGMLTIERGQSSASFTITGDEDNDAVNDEVSLTLSTDADGVSVGSPSTTTVTVVDDEIPNSRPAFALSTLDRSIPEDSPVGTPLGGPIAATDPEGDSLTYSLSGEGSDLFNVNNQGQISLSVTLNYEATPSYSLTLSVRDSKDDVGNPDSDTDDSVTVNVTVDDVDEPPGAPTDLSVSTNDDNATTALDVSWTAPDTTGIPPITGYDVQYRVQGDTNWTAHDFLSNGTTTKTTISGLDSNTTYQVQVRAKNEEGEGQWATGSGTTEKAELTVAFSSPTYTVGEGSTTDINVNVAPTADRDVTATVTMTGTGATLSGLTNGMLTIARGQSSASFTISGDQDNDNVDDVVTLTLTTNADGVTLGSPSTTTVTIEEPNNPPVITTTSPITVKENQTTVATLEATDSDDDPITGWSITGGADSALFNLTNGGVLSFKTAPDYENPKDTGSNNGYEIEVTATDGLTTPTTR